MIADDFRPRWRRLQERRTAILDTALSCMARIDMAPDERKRVAIRALVRVRAIEVVMDDMWERRVRDGTADVP